jgi:hypothetical protein
MTNQEKIPRLITIRGPVIPEKYFIWNDSQGKSLLNLFTKEVELTGLMIEKKS